MILKRPLIAFVTITILITACSSGSLSPASRPDELRPALATEAGPSVDSTPLPVRANYRPAELVDYIAQSGDTLPSLAAHFNTSVTEIRAANPIIPADATTMPPGFPMKIPIYFVSLWATPYKMLPDAAFVNGPQEVGFNTPAFVASQPGWLKDYRAYAGYQWRSGAEIVDYVATNYSVSPRLLLALLEYKSGALSDPNPPSKTFVFDFEQPVYRFASYRVYTQLFWAANTLNNGYYGWRSGKLTEFELPDGTIIRPDPWQNAATVGLEYFFSLTSTGEGYDAAVGPDGLAKTYTTLFGDPWAGDISLIPGSLQQPNLTLPFPPAQVWSYTGGPHTGWGLGAPFAAVDFAPPSEFHGCFTPEPKYFATAMADGVVARSSPDGLMLDLDGDGDERTGWVLFYLHLSAETRAPAGKKLHTGELIGYSSCQGGELVTGSHVHIARKYNGEWILADGALAFNMDGWIIHEGKAAYGGTMTRNGVTVTECVCSDIYSSIKSDYAP